MPIAGSVQNETCGLNNNCHAGIAASSARKEAAHAANETVLNAALSAEKDGVISTRIEDKFGASVA